MIPKPQYVKLRKYVLERLKLQQEQNGYAHIQHNSLQNFIALAKTQEFNPFARMSDSERAEATDIFWATLLKQGLVEKVLAPVTLSGHKELHYYLPGGTPFDANTLELFRRIG